MKQDQDPIIDYKPGALRRYDTFWPRFGAGVVDGMILSPLHWLDSESCQVWEVSGDTKTLVVEYSEKE